MIKIVVAGLINIETTLRVDEGFPITYSPCGIPDPLNSDHLKQ